MNKILIVIALFGLLSVSGCKEECPECEVCKECETCEVCEECLTCETCEVCKVCPKEKALVSVETGQWYINEYNINEMFFTMTLLNYGYVEAKDVIVECLFEDEYDNTFIKTSKKVGNIASTSVKYLELLTKIPVTLKKARDDDWFLALCYVKSCKNCEILYKRIPEYVDEIVLMQ